MHTSGKLFYKELQVMKTLHCGQNSNQKLAGNNEEFEEHSLPRDCNDDSQTLAESFTRNISEVKDVETEQLKKFGSDKLKEDEKIRKNFRTFFIIFFIIFFYKKKY